MTVTITTTKLIIEENGIQLRFDGRDIIKAVPEPINATLPAKVRAVQPQSQAFCVVLHLTGDAREALGSTYIIRLLDVTGHPAWTDDQAGADTAASEIAVMIRSASGGAGGGQVDSVVAGDAIDVDATDPANPIVSVKVDGVTIGFNGSNELEVPAGGGGYVPTTRLINTTAPLTGGGDLSVNRTIAIPQATAVTDGFLDSADWSLFNSKVSSVGATYPIQSSGGATPVISADTSTGGNGAADDGKVLIFGTEGDITGSSVTGLNAVQGIAAGNGVGVYGENNGTGPAVAGTATAGGVGGAFTATGAEGVTGTSDSEPGVRATNSSTTEAALHVNNNDPTNTGDIAAFHRNDNLGVEIRNDGGLDWTSASGAQTTANNLPVFSALNQGVVPAAGAVPSAANFLTETGIFAVPAGTGINQLTGDVTAGPGSGSQAATLASIIAAGGPTGSATVAPIITYDAKGRLTAVSSATIAPAVGSITGLGTGVATALGNNADSASGFVTQTGGDARYLTRLAASLTSDFTTNSASFVDVTGLTVTLEANSVYQIFVSTPYTSTSTSTGIGISLTATGSPTVRNMSRTLWNNNTNPAQSTHNSDDAGTILTTVNNAGTIYGCTLLLSFHTAGSSSVVQIRAVRGGSNNNVSVKSGSSIVAIKI